MNKYGISENVFNDILEVFNSIPELSVVKLFGSRARGDFKKTSDIDLAVEFSGTDKKLKLIRTLDDIKCILKFDVINIKKITNKNLIENINKDGVIIWKR